MFPNRVVEPLNGWVVRNSDDFFRGKNGFSAKPNRFNKRARVCVCAITSAAPLNELFVFNLLDRRRTSVTWIHLLGRSPLRACCCSLSSIRFRDTPSTIIQNAERTGTTVPETRVRRPRRWTWNRCLRVSPSRWSAGSPVVKYRTTWLWVFTASLTLFGFETGRWRRTFPFRNPRRPAIPTRPCSRRRKCFGPPSLTRNPTLPSLIFTSTAGLTWVPI